MDVLIIGLGSISAKHIDALRLLNCAVTIYALRSERNSNPVDGVIEICSLYELSFKPEFVIISNPTYLHSRTIASIIDLGIPIFIEKPPSHTLDGTDELIEQLKQCKITTYVGCNLRFHPCIEFLKTQFESYPQRINEVNVYCGSYLPDWRPTKDYKEIYSANRNMGGGVHLDLFHEMDYTCWLFGYPAASTGFISNKSTLEIDAPDYANYLLEYPQFNISIILNYYRRYPKRSIEILFDSDTWKIDLINNTIVSDNNGLIFQSTDFKILDTYINQMRYFIDCLRNGSEPMNTFEESIRTLKVSLKNG